MGDIRRKVFAPVVTESFAFLVQEYGCTGPVFTDNWPPNRIGSLDAVYRSPDFDVEVWFGLDYGGEADAYVYLARPPTGTGGRRLDLLAHELGLAKRQSVPTSAKTGYQLRRSLTVQAALIRRLLRAETGHS